MPVQNKNYFSYRKIRLNRMACRRRSKFVQLTSVFMNMYEDFKDILKSKKNNGLIMVQ